MESEDNRIHVLHVDDEEEFLEITRMYLECHHGDCVKITTVSHSEQVVEKLKENRYDVIVSDYQMPGMDGLELLRCLRDQNNDIPFIMFTGRGREEVAIKALNLGADYYLQKGHSEVAFTELHHFITSAVHKNQAEKKLRKSEENLRIAQKIAHLGSWEWDVVTGTVHLSEEMLRIFGFDQGEPAPYGITSLMDRTHPDDRMKVQEALETTTKTLKTGPMEYRIITLVGKEKWIKVNSQVITGESGRLERIFGYVLDITELKQAEKALRASEQKYRELVEKMLEGVVVEDANGIMIFANPQAAKLTGYSREEMTGKHWSTIIHESKREKVAEETAKRPRGIRSTYESLIKTKGGQPVPVLVHASPLFSEEKTFRGVLVVFTDISELKQVEQSLKREKKQFLTMVEQLPFAVTVYSPDGQLKSINQAFMDSWNVTPAAKEYLLAHYNIFQDEQLKAAGLMPAIEKAFTGETLVIPEARYDPRETRVTKDTAMDVFRVRVYLYPVKDEKNNVREVVLMFEDISGQKKAEK